MKRILFVLMMIFISLPLFANDKNRSTPVWMMVVHEIEDYEEWRFVFDSGLSTRQSAGELSFEINRDPGDPNQIIAILQWDTVERAQAFVDDPTVRNAMKAAGVVSDPIVTFYKGAPR